MSKCQSMEEKAQTKYGRLRIIGPAEKRGGHIHYLCECDCGVRKVVQWENLRSGHTKSCGCFRREFSGDKARTHGQSKRNDVRCYKTWCGMLRRCNNPHDERYPYYGGRGIRVCERWRSFENFAADMGEPPPGMSIDRFPDKDGDYEPGNCRWATQEEQGRNKRNNRLVTIGGRTQCLSAWAKEVGINRNTISNRLNAGWSAECALTTTVRRPATAQLPAPWEGDAEDEARAGRD